MKDFFYFTIPPQRFLISVFPLKQVCYANSTRNTLESRSLLAIFDTYQEIACKCVNLIVGLDVVVDGDVTVFLNFDEAKERIHVKDLR